MKTLAEAQGAFVEIYESCCNISRQELSMLVSKQYLKSFKGIKTILIFVPNPDELLVL